ERPSQLEAEPAPRLGLGPQHGLEEAIGPPARGLRLIEGKIGIGDQLIDVGAVIGSDGDAGAAAQVEGLFVDLEGLRQPPQHRLDALADDARIAAVAHGDDELVAAEPEYLTRLAASLRDLAQAMPDLDQQLVADRVTERVVDLLEAVEVE